MVVKGKNTLINSLTGLQTIKASDDSTLETHLNTEQIMGYVIVAVASMLVYKMSPSAANYVAGILN